MKRTTIFLGEADREAIRTIQRLYGVSTDSDAIRLALRILAEAREIGLSPISATMPDPEKRTEGQT